MIALSDQAVQEFQELYQAKFGAKPSREEAECDLLLLMELVSSVQPKNALKQR